MYKNIHSMIIGDLNHEEILLDNSLEYTKLIEKLRNIDNTNIIYDNFDFLLDKHPICLILDNYIYFIDFLENNGDYCDIIKEKVYFKLKFSYQIIKMAYDNRDFELLEFEWNRIGMELNDLISNPYKIFKLNEKGIMSAIMKYIAESIYIYFNVYDKEKVEEYFNRFDKLCHIYNYQNK